MSGASIATGESKKLHPFFTAPRNPTRDLALTSTPGASPGDTPDTPLDDGYNGVTDPEVPEQGDRRRKRRKTDNNEEQDLDDMKKPGRPRRKTKSLGGNIASHFVRLDGGDSCNDRQDPEVVADSLAPVVDTSLYPLSQAPESALNAEAAPSTATEDDNPVFHKHIITPKAKKILRFNPKTGTIGSPPKPKEQDMATDKAKAPSMKGKSPTGKIVKIAYGDDDESRLRIGSKINEVLAANKPPSNLQMKAATQSLKEKLETSTGNTGTMGVDNASKDTHPFFLGKSKKSEAKGDKATTTCKQSTAPLKQFTSTPCSPKKPKIPVTNVRLPQFGVKTMGLKVPGGQLPAWPWKGAVHIRGEGVHLEHKYSSPLPLVLRKSKGNTIHIRQEESVIDFAIGQLGIPAVLEAVRNIDTENFLPPPPELRLPEKHFESGVKLQKRILPQLRTVRPDQKTRRRYKWDERPLGGDALEAYISQCTEVHPALAQLFTSVKDSLSAFDRSLCESMSWTQKYAPTCATEVLQSGREAFLLREWLETLKVQSVDTGTDGDSKSTSGRAKSSAPAKKKRKKNKLDGFIVDSDEEANEMDEISEAEDDWTSNSGKGPAKKTVIRAGDTAAKDSKRPPRLTNAIVISGPHGCGKTAAVYAVAKELDFEVFEINPSSRRSGKDVLERIGDMTRNHLVQHRQTNGPAIADSNDIIDEEETAQDIKSGKQATMNSFFKPKPTAKTNPPKVAIKQAPAFQPESKKTSPASQKQSLILLEEVDVLYEEDKQFWVTVIGLIAQSKRPFIMTCNDESLVPLQTLSLHGIFRFSSPPVETAVDRLLMIAACEGHALQRDAVEALYETRQHDLRGALMDLNYWCQIGVGDRRGGFDWFYLRWPKGIDVDEDHNVVRVISQDTYLPGMGWLEHEDVTEDISRTTEERLLDQTWDCWTLDLGEWHNTLDLSSWSRRSSSFQSSPQGHLALLEAYDEFADAMGVADLCSSKAFATSFKEPIDCSLPELSPKVQEDFISGPRLLDAPVLISYDSLPAAISVSLKSAARKHLQIVHETITRENPPELDGLREGTVISNIRGHLSQDIIAETAISRYDFSLAFDPLAVPDRNLPGSQGGSAASHLDPSVFDGTLTSITVDVAPYVRNIVAYDTRLQQQRLKLSNLLSKGGKGNSSKRMRTTRAALSAMEGGSRSTTRAERWFKADLNSHLVMRTGGRGWEAAVIEQARVSDDNKTVRDLDDSADELGDSMQGSSDMEN